MKKNRLVVALAILFAGSTAYGLDVSDGSGASYNPLQTAVPALSIAPDAVGGGMGDVGAATAPDLASQYWNPSKYIKKLKIYLYKQRKSKYSLLTFHFKYNISKFHCSFKV